MVQFWFSIIHKGVSNQVLTNLGWMIISSIEHHPKKEHNSNFVERTIKKVQAKIYFADFWIY